MTELNTQQHKKLFDNIKQHDSDNNEFWSARDLQTTLGYQNWENFEITIARAKESYLNSNIGIDIKVLFRDSTKQLKKSNQHGEYAIEVPDIHLSRYACYLIAQNGNPRKIEIAAAQFYFAIQTYRQEKMDEMSDDQKRLYIRSQVKSENTKLVQTAKDSGVSRYGTFNDAGYLGLYGLRAKQIKEKKNIGVDDILNRAGATELAANLFRITQTQEKLKNELDNGNKVGEIAATKTHFMVGGKVRQTIKDIGGTLPENIPAEEDVRNLIKRIGKKSPQPLGTLPLLPNI